MSVVGTIIGVIVFLVVAATAFDNAVSDTVTREVGTSDVVEEDAPAAAGEPALAAAQELVLGETAFGVDTPRAA